MTLACRNLDLSKGELSILLTDDKTIKELNKQFRKIDKPTDVLAFPYQPQAFGDIEVPLPIGDIIISIDRAAEQAKDRGLTLEEELEVLLIHGLLHLIGYKDETRKDRSVMEEKTTKVLKLIRKQK